MRALPLLLLVAALTACGSPGAGEAAPGYAFDVTDRRYLAAFADAVVVGRIVARTGPGPTYRVELVRALKGDPPAELEVVHVGGDAGEPAPLERGGLYVLVLGRGADGGWTTVAGPTSAVPVAGPDAAPVRDFERAVREQRWPLGVPRR